MRYTTVVLLWLTAALSQAADAELDLATVLENQSCDGVWTDAGFSMDVLRRSFPVPRGFRFVGVERGLVVFRRTPGSSDEVIDRFHKDRDTTLQEEILRLNRERASITYGEKADIVLGDTGVTRQVATLQWSGLNVFFWTSVGGSIVTTKTYQVVVQDEDYQIAVTALDPGLISKVVGCSKSLEGAVLEE